MPRDERPMKNDRIKFLNVDFILNLSQALFLVEEKWNFATDMLQVNVTNDGMVLRWSLFRTSSNANN